VWDLAFIGAGSSTAYYIDTLGKAYDHSKTLLFGNTGDNPWAGKRGFSIDFINHSRRQIDFPSQTTTAHPRWKGARSTKIFVKRAKFAEDAARIIAQAIPKEQCISEKITAEGIQKSAAGGTYDIVTETRTWKVKKVVFAAGAGGHREPKYKDSKIAAAQAYEMDAPPGLRGTRVIDMDHFIREVVNPSGGPPGRRKGKRKRKVVVIGPNAAIDVVAAARLFRWDVVWFSGDPAFLPGTFYLDPPYEIQKVERVDAVHVDVVKAGQTLTVYYCEQKKSGAIPHLRTTDCSVPQDSKNKVENVDYVVYGIGGRGTVSALIEKTLAAELKEMYEGSFKFAPADYSKTLKPRTDLPVELQEYINDRIRKVDPIPKNEGFEARLVQWVEENAKKNTEGKALLGLKDVRGGLEVIGAAAEAHPKGRAEDKPGGVTATLSSDVLASGQLTYIRAAMAARNRFIPSAIVRQVDFGHSNADVLRSYISIHYPNIEGKKYEDAATEAITLVMALGRDDRIPHGYTRQQDRIIREHLDLLNKACAKGETIEEVKSRVIVMGQAIMTSIRKSTIAASYIKLLKDTGKYDAWETKEHAKMKSLGLEA